MSTQKTTLILVTGILIALTVTSLALIASGIDLSKTLATQTDQTDLVIKTNNIGENEQTNVNTSESTELTQSDKDALIFMREEEKLARDVYLTLAEEFNLNIFTNIAKSEQKHMDEIKTLLEKYNLPDPVENKEVGEFTNPELQSLYQKLVETGMQSEVQALMVGATIEDLDIFDLSNRLADTNNSDITPVFTNLRKGSYNHLRSFVKNLTNRNSSYTPVYISKSEFETILSQTNTQSETGNPSKRQK